MSLRDGSRGSRASLLSSRGLLLCRRRGLLTSQGRLLRRRRGPLNSPRHLLRRQTGLLNSQGRPLRRRRGPLNSQGRLLRRRRGLSNSRHGADRRSSRLLGCPWKRGRITRDAHGRGPGSGCREASGNARGAEHEGTESEEGYQRRRPRDQPDGPRGAGFVTTGEAVVGIVMTCDERGQHGDRRRGDATHRVSGVRA